MPEDIPEKPYSCAGWGRQGALNYVNAEEAKHAGAAGFPWPQELKDQAVDALNGALDELEIGKRLSAIADAHQGEAMMAAKRARAEARA